MSKSAGTPFIVSAPSGTGKTSLVRALLGALSDLELSTSHTTRAPRPGEVDGTHYHFVDQSAFEALVAADDMLEYANVYGNLYGTSRAFVNQRLAFGADIILEIDWQGARIARERLAGSVCIMIAPPSLEALSSRLMARGQDSEAVVARRLAAASEELAHFTEFDYLIVNNHFETALDELRTIVKAQRLSMARQQQHHTDLLTSLTRGLIPHK
jgi:guanylate kinase